jgi:hypothetical protein
MPTWSALKDLVAGLGERDINRPLGRASGDEPLLPAPEVVAEAVARELLCIRQRMAAALGWLEQGIIADFEFAADDCEAGRRLAVDELHDAQTRLHECGGALLTWLRLVGHSSIVPLDAESWAALCALAEDTLPHPHAGYVSELVKAAVVNLSERQDAPAVVARGECERLRACGFKLKPDRWPSVQVGGGKPWPATEAKNGKSGKASRAKASAGKAAVAVA